MYIYSTKRSSCHTDPLHSQNQSVPEQLYPASTFIIRKLAMESSGIRHFSWRVALLFAFLLAIQYVQSANASPVSLNPYEDYVEKGDQPSLYELLLQREILADKMDADGRHLVVRKSDRSPSLRLRFGRRADPDVSRHPTSIN